jgi:hypothetical protein
MNMEHRWILILAMIGHNARLNSEYSFSVKKMTRNGGTTHELVQNDP